MQIPKDGLVDGADEGRSEAARRVGVPTEQAGRQRLHPTLLGGGYGTGCRSRSVVVWTTAVIALAFVVVMVLCGTGCSVALSGFPSIWPCPKTSHRIIIGTRGLWTRAMHMLTGAITDATGWPQRHRQTDGGGRRPAANESGT